MANENGGKRKSPMHENFVELIVFALSILERRGRSDSISLDYFTFDNIRRGEYAFHVINEKLSPLEKSELLAAFDQVGSGEIAPIGGAGTKHMERMSRMVADHLAKDWKTSPGNQIVDDSTTPGPLSIVAACSVIGLGRAFDHDIDTVEEVCQSDCQLVRWCIQYLKKHVLSEDLDGIIEKLDLT